MTFRLVNIPKNTIVTSIFIWNFFSSIFAINTAAIVNIKSTAKQDEEIIPYFPSEGYKKIIYKCKWVGEGKGQLILSQQLVCKLGPPIAIIFIIGSLWLVRTINCRLWNYYQKQITNIETGIKTENKSVIEETKILINHHWELEKNTPNVTASKHNIS